MELTEQEKEILELVIFAAMPGSKHSKTLWDIMNKMWEE